MSKGKWYYASYCCDCRPGVWPRLPIAAPPEVEKTEAEGKMGGMT